MGTFHIHPLPKLIVITCLPNHKGLFRHAIFNGRTKVTEFGVSEIYTDPAWLNMMRTDPEEFLKKYCFE